MIITLAGGPLDGQPFDYHEGSEIHAALKPGLSEVRMARYAVAPFVPIAICIDGGYDASELRKVMESRFAVRRLIAWPVDDFVKFEMDGALDGQSFWYRGGYAAEFLDELATNEEGRRFVVAEVLRALQARRQ